MNSVVILCNGAFPTQPYPLHLLDSAEGVVCCDGALVKWLERTPSARPLMVVGDMDSLPKELQERFSSCIFHETEQDYNDLTKAMRWVLREHPEVSEITILGATGLREDHTIGNLGLLMEYTRMFELGERRVSMVSDYGTAFAITDSCDLRTYWDSSFLATTHKDRHFSQTGMPPAQSVPSRKENRLKMLKFAGYI